MLHFSAIWAYTIHSFHRRRCAIRFCEQLNEYITRLDCRGKELAEAAGLSAPSLSRYRTGERTPGRGSAVLTALSDALADMAKAKALPDMDADTLYSAFLQCDEYVGTDKKMLRENFNALIEVMGLSVAKLCRCANYDPSAIFRFRRGERQPAEPEQFAAAVASYISREMDGPTQREVAAALLGCAAEDLGDRAAYCRRVQDWLLGSHAPREDSVSRFLTKLDEFDLNAYIRSVHFDELKVPVAPFQLPTSRSYSGLRQMMDSELDFMKAAVLSRSTEPVFMYSDMPMTEMAQDPEFPKKWMFGMALLLKKGLRLQIIHNIDRNLPEMMLGLESFIPMYMTGQIEPYYFKAPQGGVFLHFLRVSGTAALTGEAVSGHHSEGRYYLTNNRAEVAYYRRRADALLENAKPLMGIYRADGASRLNAFLLADSRTLGRRRCVLSAPPLYTADPAFLTAVLQRHDVPAPDQERILAHAKSRREQAETILRDNEMVLALPRLTEEAFERYPMSLPLSGSFYERDIPYTYQEYLEHIDQTEQFAAVHPRCRLELTADSTFRNLQIVMHEGRWAMVSKEKSPAIHFVIRHAKLRSAIESFEPPLVEE